MVHLQFQAMTYSERTEAGFRSVYFGCGIKATEFVVLLD
jgi:hypothetical protein